MMHSADLGFCSRSDFLNIASMASEVWDVDILYSGEGYGENGGLCCIIPTDILVINDQTELSELKAFAFADDRETLGFFSYDLGLVQKGIFTEKDRYMELGMLKKYAAYLSMEDGRLKAESASAELIERLGMLTERNGGAYSIGEPVCNMLADDYKSKVSEVLEYIRGGHTYQLNLSVMFESEFSGDALSLWLGLAEDFPAPFYAYIHSSEGRILSTSPERFIKVADGDVLSQPIKGTHRGDADESVLTDSRKESAELSMIVDLIRNDISEKCSPGSVVVNGHKKIMRVENLMQMYSNVEGRLAGDADVLDLLWSAFPGGSITGCPKRRSMEIIDDMEPHSRGIYCGSIFRIKDRKNMDSSITIRTAYLSRGKMRFFAGSGIVAESVPDAEYNETIAKAEKFLRLNR